MLSDYRNLLDYFSISFYSTLEDSSVKTRKRMDDSENWDSIKITVHSHMSRNYEWLFVCHSYRIESSTPIVFNSVSSDLN